ncbi:unnamed protein product [marine sediment metagenome]|uniref:Uncharacterized protein n=1 Tax=marine sediment metagenome TaxID=412755 RepID=X1RZ96_9ZZZZ
MSVTIFRKKAIMEGGEKMPAKVHMSKKELNDLIEAGEKTGTDTSQLKSFLAELPSEKAARNLPPRPARRLEPERAAEELVTGPELERLRLLACPHIRGSPYWEDYVSRRVLACSDCQRAGLPLGERLQPTLF